jgi:rod shape-determining protein MreC
MGRIRLWINLKSKISVNLLVLVILSVLLIILPQNFRTDLSALIFKGTFGPFYSFRNYIKELEGVRDENRKLLEKIVELSLRNSWLKEEHLENQRMRELLEFRQSLDTRVIPAEVLADEPNRRYFSILIDKGTGNGVRRNMPVVNVNGLVGKVVEATASSAVVQLMIDPNFRAAAQDEKTRVLGIVKLWSGSKLRLDNVPLQEEANAGDRIITSGLGGIFPSGINIGVITAVESVEDSSKLDRSFGIFKMIEVTPYVDFNRLEELFVLDVKR